MELATLREVAARFRPDLVIIAYVLNDTERSGPSDVDSQAGGGRRPLINTIHHKLKQVSMAYTYLAPKIGAAFGVLFNGRYAVGGTREIIESYHEESPGWIEARQAILDIATEARKIGAPAVVVVFPMMIDFSTYPLRSAHETITRFCQHNGIPVLDLLPRFANEEASDLAIFLDGHPNAGAHKIFADEILHYLSHTDASLMHAAIASAQHERTLALRPAGSHSSRLSAMRELPTRTTAP